jgi:glutamate racemase
MFSPRVTGITHYISLEEPHIQDLLRHHVCKIDSVDQVSRTYNQVFNSKVVNKKTKQIMQKDEVIT